MRDETLAARPEVDVLKFYIWLMVGMTVVLAVLYWIVWSDLQSTRKNLEMGRQLVSTQYAQDKRDIIGMLNVYKTNKEDEARNSPQGWFSSIWRTQGIPENSIVPGNWKPTPDYHAKGNFDEERFELTFNPKMPLSREQIAKFCHAVERSSARLRVIELDLRRAERDDFEKDAWAGKVTIGYRHAHETP